MITAIKTTTPAAITTAIIMVELLLDEDDENGGVLVVEATITKEEGSVGMEEPLKTIVKELVRTSIIKNGTLE